MTDYKHDTSRADRLSETAGVPVTLTEEHAQLLSAVSDRTKVLVRDAEDGRWPILALRELVDYLHLEVLQHIVNVEWLLFRSASHAPEELARLRRDHLELRLAIDLLTQAAAGGDDLSSHQLAVAAQDLLARLEEHFAAEEKVLAIAGEPARATTTLGCRPHEWYALTQKSVIDLDAMPGQPGIDVVLERLVRMDPGETVGLRAGFDLGPLWQRLCRADPGGYGIAVLQSGPTQWRIEVSCRPAR